MAPKVVVDQSSRGVVAITLSRPDRRNALDGETIELLAAAVASASADAEVRVIVLRGAGPHFCAGADMSRADPDAPRRPEPIGIVDLCSLLDGSPKATIAVVQGACIGGGVALAACCDVVLARQDAVFAMPEVRLGFAPGPLAVFFARAMPVRALRRYMVSGERFGAERALALGLVHEIADEVDIEAALEEAVEAFLAAAPGALADAKRFLGTYLPTPPTPQLLADLKADFDGRAAGAEADEGRASFREKRRPRWAV